MPSVDGAVATEAAASAPDPNADATAVAAADAPATGGADVAAAATEDGDSAEPGTVAGADGEADVEDDDDDGDDVDAELEAMKQRLKEMEEESNAGSKPALPAEGKPAADAASPGTTPSPTAGGAAVAAGAGSNTESDGRSIYVGNVDYASTPEELQAHFADCGTINRVTIMCNKMTGAPKGFAYIEFVDEDAVQNALILNESPFRGRQLKVTPKRTNVPGMNFRGGRGGYRGRGQRGRGYRGRPRGRWVPY